ncbi:MAG: hypothetical protein HN348_25990, partial [Proteobacteria bacterium]|nr:hypothetical protein [Pseudomonadota bacterium]
MGKYLAVWLGLLVCGCDEPDPPDMPTDADNDGAPAEIDCDDANSLAYPGAVETCNEVDDDCDGLVDEDAGEIWYADADGDGFGGYENTYSCDEPSGYVADGGDCDDWNADISPDATENCNGIDDDCNHLIDDSAADAPSWFPDVDGDGLGYELGEVVECDPPSGFVDNSDDCDDGE